MQVLKHKILGKVLWIVSKSQVSQQWAQSSPSRQRKLVLTLCCHIHLFSRKKTLISSSTSQITVTLWKQNTFFNLTVSMNICHTDSMKHLKINIDTVTHQAISNSLLYLLTFVQKEVLYFFPVLVGICSLTGKFLYTNVISCWSIQMLPSSETQDFKRNFFFPAQGRTKKRITSISCPFSLMNWRNQQDSHQKRPQTFFPK